MTNPIILCSLQISQGPFRGESVVKPAQPLVLLFTPQEEAWRCIESSSTRRPWEKCCIHSGVINVHMVGLVCGPQMHVFVLLPFCGISMCCQVSVGRPAALWLSPGLI